MSNQVPQLTHAQVARTELKYQHALDLIGDLGTMIEDWNALDQVSMKPVLVSPRRVEFQLDVLSDPPQDEWALTFADALHNYRSALDTLAWESANLDPGNPPRKPKDIYFPTTSTDREWDKWVGRLTDIPTIYLDRMKLARTIHSEDGAPLAVTLHQLDIDDKHRGLLQAGAGVDNSTFNLQIEPPAGVPTISGKLTPIKTAKALPLQTGAVVGGYTSNVDFRLRDDSSQKVNVTVSLDIGTMHVRALQFASVTAAGIRLIIDLVRYGQEEAVKRAVSTGAVGSFES